MSGKLPSERRLLREQATAEARPVEPRYLEAVRVRLMTGEEGYVTELHPDHWLVTLDQDEPRGVRHDRRTGVTACECGQPMTCNHRTAVWRVFEGRPIAPVIR